MRVPEFFTLHLRGSVLSSLGELQVSARPDDTGHVRVSAALGAMPFSKSAFVTSGEAVTVAFMLLKSAAMACPTDDLPALRRRMDDLMHDTGFKASIDRVSGPIGPAV